MLPLDEPSLSGTGAASFLSQAATKCLGTLLRLSFLNLEARPYNDFQGMELTAKKKSEPKVLNHRFIPSLPRDV